MKTLSGFISSIDNLSMNVKDVRSMLVVPVYGHRDKNIDN